MLRPRNSGPLALTRRFVLAGLAGLAGAVLRPDRGRAMSDALLPVDRWDWTYVADTVMGGVSEGTARILVEDGAPVLRLTGTVSTANRGGFIQARTTLDTPPPAETRGLRLRVRGNGERYFVHLRSRASRLPWQFYQAPFETSDDWHEVDLPFDAFGPSGGLLPDRIDPVGLRSIGVAAYGRDHNADLSLAALGFF